MTLYHLPPEITQYIGPVFTPVVDVLLTVLGVPVVMFCWPIWVVIQIPGFKSVTNGLGELLVGLLVFLVMALLVVVLAVIALAALWFVGVSLFVVGLACWERNY